MELVESYTNFKQLPFKKHSPLFATISTYTIDNSFDNKNNDEAIKYEIDWLRYSCLILKTVANGQNNILPSTVTPGIHLMLPPINKKVASVEAQYHCMGIIHKTIKFFNENQIPFDVSDQPVYVYSKEVQ